MRAQHVFPTYIKKIGTVVHHNKCISYTKQTRNKIPEQKWTSRRCFPWVHFWSWCLDNAVIFWNKIVSCYRSEQIDLKLYSYRCFHKWEKLTKLLLTFIFVYRRREYKISKKIQKNQRECWRKKFTSECNKRFSY